MDVNAARLPPRQRCPSQTFAPNRPHRHHVSQSSHNTAKPRHITPPRPVNPSSCEPILTQQPSATTNQPGETTHTVIVRANPHTTTAKRTKGIDYHPNGRCGYKTPRGIRQLRSVIGIRRCDQVCHVAGSPDRECARTYAVRRKQAPGSPDIPITRRCVCPGMHKPADAKRLYRSAAPFVWLRIAPHT